MPKNLFNIKLQDNSTLSPRQIHDSNSDTLYMCYRFYCDPHRSLVHITESLLTTHEPFYTEYLLDLIHLERGKVQTCYRLFLHIWSIP